MMGAEDGVTERLENNCNFMIRLKWKLSLATHILPRYALSGSLHGHYASRIIESDTKEIKHTYQPDTKGIIYR